jgi:hypothetical protein
MKAKYIKRREQFGREAEALLQRLGAAKGPPGDLWPVYILDTPAGELRLSIHTDLWLCDKSWFRGGGFPWIAGRFEDVKVARELTHGESNPYFGKWNHHYWHGWTDDFGPGLSLLEHRLLRVVVEDRIPILAHAQQGG